MPNPNALYEDMQKLDDLYNELLWHPDDELQFTHDGQKIIITNTTLEKKQWNSDSPLRQRSSTHVLQCSVSSLLLAPTWPLGKSFLGYGNGIVSSCCHYVCYICGCFCDDTIWRRINTIEYRRRKPRDLCQLTERSLFYCLQGGLCLINCFTFIKKELTN